MKALRYSVVVTNYNYGCYVREAINSALLQILAPAEVIVVDDGSTDGSQECLKSTYGADPRVRLIFKENGGQLSAFIAGADATRADTDIVCFLDADDYWSPEYLQGLQAVYAQQDGPEFVFTNLRFSGAREGLWNENTDDHDFGLTALPTLYLQEWIGAPTSALSMRRNLALRALSLPPVLHEDWRVRADDCLVYAASVLGARKHYVASTHVFYRVHDNNLHLNRSKNRIADLKHTYRVQRLLGWWAIYAGFGADSLRYTKLEFKTKRAPTSHELEVYLQLLRLSSLGLFKKIEHRISIYRWYFQGRQRTVRLGAAQRISHMNAQTRSS